MGNAKLKQTKNLFNSLSQDEFSVFYATDKISGGLLNKAKKSFYSKDKLFVRSYNESENKNDLYIRNYKFHLPIHNPFVEQIKYIDCSTLFTIKGPSDLLMPILHAQNFWRSQPLIQNIVYYLIFLLLKFIRVL